MKINIKIKCQNASIKNDKNNGRITKFVRQHIVEKKRERRKSKLEPSPHTISKYENDTIKAV